MRLKARNFGPLKYLDIEVKPLTILIGKNSLGKSYAAQLLYVMLCVLSDFRRRRYPFLYAFEDRIEMRRVYPRDIEVTELTNKIRNQNLGDSSIIEETVELILKAEAENLQRILEVWLYRVFGVNTFKLVNITSSKAELECSIFEDVRLRVEITRRHRMKVHLSLPKQKVKSYVEEFAPILQKIKQKRKKKTYVEELMRSVEQKLIEQTKEISFRGHDLWGRKAEPFAYYIPAGRAGLIESYDTVVEALFFHAAGTPSSGLSISPLPGMANQFYGVLRSLNGEKGPLSKEITRDFLELLGGDVRLSGVRFKKSQKAARVRMMYHFSLGESASWIELTHAASMIKELAPIYLIVQEVVKPGQYLIVEEPESHLHPGAQFALAKIFAKLAHLQVNVVLTTHSPIMLRKFSHFIRKEVNESAENVEPSRAAIYWMKEEKLGSISQVLKISDFGTLEKIPTYDEVVNELYEEEVSLSKEDA